MAEQPISRRRRRRAAASLRWRPPGARSGGSARTRRTRAPAFPIGLEDTPELNGVRVKLEEPLFAAGAPPTEEKRWRVRRRDNSEALTMKIDNLAPEMPGVLPYLIAVGVAGAEENYAANWLDTGGGVDAPSRSLQADTGGTLLMLACLKGKAAFAKDLIERGANVNARDDDGLTALIAAVAHPEVVALLLDAGARAPALLGRARHPRHRHRAGERGGRRPRRRRSAAQRTRRRRRWSTPRDATRSSRRR